jgi:hypothetical protein
MYPLSRMAEEGSRYLPWLRRTNLILFSWLEITLAFSYRRAEKN